MGWLYLVPVCGTYTVNRILFLPFQYYLPQSADYEPSRYTILSITQLQSPFLGILFALRPSTLTVTARIQIFGFRGTSGRVQTKRPKIFTEL